MYRPRLRQELRVTEDGVLVDPLPDRDVQLSPVGRALVRELDGRSELGAILAHLVESGFARAEVETAFRWLLLVHAVEGAGDATATRAGRIARGELALPLVILDGARFECQGSGACCRSYVFGPLYDDDVERLESLELPDVEGPFVVIGASGLRTLRTVDERCIFLDADERCRIHLRYGAEAKPRICRLYPLEAHATVAGLRIGDRGSCARFATSARRGPLLADELERARPLLADMEHELFHPIVTIDGIPCDFGIALEFGKTALALARRSADDAVTTLSAIGAGLARLRAALARCPLEPGEPDRTVAAEIAAAPTWRGGGDQGTGGAALADLLGELAVDLPALAPRALDLFTLAARAARGEPYAGAAAVRVDDGDIEAVLRLSLRQQLFGLRAIVEHRVAAGLVRIAVIQALTLWGARAAAAREGRAAVRADDLSQPHMLAIRALESAAAEKTLSRREGAWQSILAALPSIASLG